MQDFKEGAFCSYEENAPGEKDYTIILSRPSAINDFERLLAIGNSQAKSYALVGIRALNPKRYQELSPSFRSSKDDVVTQSGCIEWHETLSKILKRVEAGEYLKGTVGGIAR